VSTLQWRRSAWAGLQLACMTFRKHLYAAARRWSRCSTASAVAATTAVACCCSCGMRAAEGRGRPRFALNHSWLCPIGTAYRVGGDERSTAWHRVTSIRRLMSCRASARIGERHGPEAISLGTRTGRHHIRVSVGSLVSAMRRAAQLMQTRLRPMLPPAGDHIDPDLRRHGGLERERQRADRQSTAYDP